MTQKDKQTALENSLRTLAARVDKLSSAQPSAQSASQASYVKELESKLANLDNRLSVLEVTAPPELRALSCDAVSVAVKENPYVEFEILADWGAPGGSYMFQKGATIRADHHTGIVGYVKNGLLIGVPTDQKKQIEELRAQRTLQIA